MDTRGASDVKTAHRKVMEELEMLTLTDITPNGCDQSQHRRDLRNRLLMLKAIFVHYKKLQRQLLKDLCNHSSGNTTDIELCLH